jgi:hypothetical protein
MLQWPEPVALIILQIKCHILYTGTCGSGKRFIADQEEIYRSRSKCPCQLDATVVLLTRDHEHNKLEYMYDII